MDNHFKELLDKQLRHDEARQKPGDVQPGGSFVETHNSPYDRLRSSLRRIFPYYPDVFDFNSSEGQKKD